MFLICHLIAEVCTGSINEIDSASAGHDILTNDDAFVSRLIKYTATASAAAIGRGSAANWCNENCANQDRAHHSGGQSANHSKYTAIDSDAAADVLEHSAEHNKSTANHSNEHEYAIEYIVYNDEPNGFQAHRPGISNCATAEIFASGYVAKRKRQDNYFDQSKYVATKDHHPAVGGSGWKYDIATSTY